LHWFMLPGESAIGKCFYVGDSTTTCRRIVGVAADTKSGGIREPEALLYDAVDRGGRADAEGDRAEGDERKDAAAAQRAQRELKVLGQRAHDASAWGLRVGHTKRLRGLFPGHARQRRRRLQSSGIQALGWRKILARNRAPHFDTSIAGS
jgi:hypothetical protein